MTRLISILLLSGFLLQSFSKVLILANYELNKEFISKNLCENKNKPQKQCKGKCQLKKQLDKEEQNESAPVNNIKIKLETQLFEQQTESVFLNNYSSSDFSFAPFQLKKITSPSFSFFHPPSA